MKFIILLNLIAISILILSCNHKKSQTIELNALKNISENLIPLESNYKVRITAFGKVSDTVEIQLLMNNRITNFANKNQCHLEFNDFTLYEGDWYQDTLGIKIKNNEHIIKNFKFDVDFFY